MANFQSTPIAETTPRPRAALALDRVALNLVTTGFKRPLPQVLDACLAVGITTVSLWEDHYRGDGVGTVRAWLSERGMSVNTVCRMSGFGGADSNTQWQQAIAEAHRVVEEAAILGAHSVTVIGGGMAQGSTDLRGTRQRIQDGIAAVLPAARQAGVALAIEPLHPMVAAERGAINTVAQALALAEQLGAGTGVMIDAYNSWWDPALVDSISRASGKIAGFQVSDWLLPTTDLAFDRGMMGDGVIDLPGIRAMVERAGYSGPVEVEVLSGRWSTRPLHEVLEAVVTRVVGC